MISARCFALFAGFSLGALACTHVYVQPLRSSDELLTPICIERNPKVRVSDFLRVLEAGFLRHGIETRVVEAPAGEDCDSVVTYTALRSWDIVPYLNYAGVRVSRDGTTVATAAYSHGGGFGFNKWRGTRAKMNPVLDQLLENYDAAR